MTEKGLKLIMDFEGLPAKKPLEAYWDSYGKVWTIGYGATHYLDGSPVKKGDKLKSKSEAVELLKMMLKDYEKKVYELVKVPINYYQHDALTSFAYNCGVANLKKSTLLKKVNGFASETAIRSEFGKWNKSGGKVLPGLSKRRRAEADLFFTKYEVTDEGSTEDKKEPAVTKNDTEWTTSITTDYPLPKNDVVTEEVKKETVEEQKTNTQEPKKKNIFGWLKNLRK